MLISRIDLSAAQALVPALFLALVAAPSAVAAEPSSFSFTPAAKYRPDVPTVPQMTGFEVGARYVDHATVTRIVDAIDDASERVRGMRYGATNEGRALLLAVVTSPENHARWPKIEEDLAKLGDPRRLGADADAERDALIASLPVVVWLSFSVHGNEASGTESALALLYHLAAADDPGVEALLRDAVIVIDPCLNPDGRDRYVQWFRTRMGKEPNPDPQAAEHSEPWPGGRPNHYYFDLNRDWAFLTQVETRARLRQYRKFQPQVHADLHEMSDDSSYFFFPAAAPIHDDFPRSTVEFGKLFGQANAAAFDRLGFAYYTAESFDLFYPGYGDSWPSLNGAIGMTYEQAGHSRSGVAVERSDGAILTLRDRAAHHFTAALTTAETAVRNRTELLRSYARFYSDALWEGEHGAIKDFVLVPGRDEARVRELVALLSEQGVEVQRAAEGFAAERVHAFSGGAATQHVFPPGCIVVRLAQPRRHLAKALLEPGGAVRENEFYDVSAWSLPLAFGVEAWWTERPVAAALQPVTSETFATAAPLAIDADGTVGWLVEWDSFAAPRFLAAATRGNLRVRSATQPFTLDGRAFPRGTLYVARGEQRTDVDWKAVLGAALADSGARAAAAASGWAERGPDLGSDQFRPLAATSIAIATGPGTSAYAVGALRWLLEARYGIPFTMIDLDDLSSADLRRYNVLVLPDGFGFRGLSGAKENLQGFAEHGGVIVALGGSAFALAEGAIGLVGVKTASDPPPASESKPAKPVWRLAADRRIRALEENIPGTMFRLEFDPSHPIAFGYDDAIAVLMDSTRAFALEGPGSRMGVFPENSLLAGFASTQNVAKLDGKAYLADIPLGRGRVLLFAGDPTFRGFVRGQVGLLMNAILLFAEPLPPPAVQRVPR